VNLVFWKIGNCWCVTTVTVNTLHVRYTP